MRANADFERLQVTTVLLATSQPETELNIRESFCDIDRSDKGSRKLRNLCAYVRVSNQKSVRQKTRTHFVAKLMHDDVLLSNRVQAIAAADANVIAQWRPLP